MDELNRLARAAGAGDDDALRAFVTRTYNDVRRFCASILGEQDADDAAQSTYAQAVRSLATFRGQSSARTWILSIARHVCTDELRARGRKRRRDQLLEPTEKLMTADPGQQAAVADLLRQLGPERRTAFVLTQMLGLSYEETARVCDCPVGTVRSRVARARSDLLQILGSGFESGHRVRPVDRTSSADRRSANGS